MFLPSLRGKGRPWLALLLFLLSPATSHASTANQADVQLQTDLSTMVIRVDQGAPLPPGGCVGGYSWHTTYGGCRIAQTQAEYAQCPAGYTGNQVRYRTYYVLQANASDVAYEGWGAWQEGCTAARASGVVDTVIAKARGNENGDTSGSNASVPSANMRAQMAVNYGTLFGVTIYRPSAQLNCLYASGSTSSSGEGSSQTWVGELVPPGQSKFGGGSGGSVGHCQLLNGNLSAELYGTCDYSSGGDGDFCMARRILVNITSVSGCMVRTETLNITNGRQLIDVGAYDICH
ncbi:hypothetical protein FQZ97_490910 [compost metagenome]